MTTEILLIRHGEAYNTAPPDGLREVLDPSNPPLTPLGEQQGNELKPILEDFAPDAIIVSPFLRAVQTPWPYIASSAVPTFVDIRFGEQFAHSVFAGFRGIDLTHYRERFGSRIVCEASLAQRASFPDFPEPPESVRQRVLSMWREWEEGALPHRRIAFVGHGASLGALLLTLVPSICASSGHVNCGVSHLKRTGDVWDATYINRHDHLSRSGEPAGLSIH